MRLRIAWLLLLGMTLATAPAVAQTLYSNGMCSLGSGGCSTDAWYMDFGFAVSDNFTIGGSGGTMTGFDMVVWLLPGDKLLTIDWSVSTAEFGGTKLAGGTADPTLTLDQGHNFGGFEIQNYNVAIPNLPLSAGTYWLNLSNATTPSGNPVAWDENSGASLASENQVGTIPSESFDITGSTTSGTGTTPEPGSIVLLGSGLLAFAGTLRHKLFHR